MLKRFSYYFCAVLFAGLLLSSFQAHSQWYDPEKVDPKAGTVYAQAYEDATSNNYASAFQHLDEALKIDPRFVDVYLSRAGIYSTLKNYPAAVTDYEKGLQMDTLYARPFLLQYSIALAGAGRFEEALEAINRFLRIPGLNEHSTRAGAYRKSVYTFAIDYAKKHPGGGYLFTPRNMGDSINSPASEYFPSLTIDGGKMIFTRRIDSDEDFYESNFVNGQWSKARPLSGKVNTNLNEGAQNISQDGTLLVFTGCNYPEGEGSCDLYYSLKTTSGWSEPRNLGRTINTDLWESSPSLSPDKKDLYFSSSRAGGLGGKDIWVSHRLPNGQWGEPENLGEAINTPADETCPFIHADNQTLYFNSTGHMGYGMADLFVSRKANDSSWTLAQNLGYPINTIDDEGSLIIAADGRTAYYASDRSDSKGGLDIYTFQLREDVAPARTLWVRGKVFDKKTNAGLPSGIELTDIDKRITVSRLQTDEEGNYLVTLPVGRNYAFTVNRKGYLFYSDNFFLSGGNPDSSFTKDIPLEPIAVGASIVLRNIFFDSRQFDLKPASLTELDKVVALLHENPRLAIQISGHTDNVGQDKDNLVLSNNRAKAVVDYLISKGIAAGRLSFKGFGATKPVADNSSEAGRAQNRRTELSVMGN